MSNFKLVESKTIPLTQAMAQEFRDMAASPTERPLDPRRLKHLREKAEAGHLITFNWSTVKIGDKEVRMNGQHSSTMLCELNGNFPEGLMVHRDTYAVNDVDGQALLFRQFDDRKSGRTAGDVSGAYQGLYEAISDTPRIPAKLAVEGVAWYRRVVEGAPAPTGDDRYSLFGEAGLHSFIQYAGDTIGMKQPEMRKDTLLAAMYATFNMNEDEARDFWLHVSRGGVEYEPEHPATVLSSWLQDARKGEIKIKPKAAHYYQAAIYAWNAHRSEKTLKSMPSNFDKIKGWLEPVI